MQKRERIPWLLVFVLAILVIGMTGCSGQASTTTSAAASPSSQTALPRPSVSAAPSATATTAVTAAATNGWAIYRDSHVAFQVPLPPGWRADSFTFTQADGQAHYIVQFFPPQSHGHADVAAASMEPELIQVTVVSAAPYISVEGDPNWTPETQPVAIGNTHSTMYNRTAPDGGELDRDAATKRGALQFVFYLHELSSTTLDWPKVNSTTALYLGMLQGFQFLTN